MKLERQVLFWIGALAAVVLLTWVLRDVLLPFVAGMALAYLLNPLADRMEQVGIHRMVATLLITGSFVLLFILVMLLLIPVLGSQIFAFIQQVPGYVSRLQQLITDESQQWLHQWIGDQLPDIRQSLTDLVTQGAGWFGTFLQSLWSGGRTLVSVLALAIITPVVAFYLLHDWHRMVDKIDSWLPLHQRETIRDLARQMDATIARFVRGQAIVCLILGFYYAVALSLAGLNFALLIGISAGIISFIPYVGSLFGLVLGTTVAAAQFWPEWTWIALIAAIFLFGQFVEGYILAPKLVGDSVGLHPVWLMFSLFAFGYLFGFVGILLAVPLAAVTGVLVRFAVRRYLASPLYSGAPRKRAPGRKARPR